MEGEKLLEEANKRFANVSQTQKKFTKFLKLKFQARKTVMALKILRLATILVFRFTLLFE